MDKGTEISMQTGTQSRTEKFRYTYGLFHPVWRMTPKKWHYLWQNLFLNKYKYWRVTANL